MKILHFILGKANPNRANGVNHVIHGLCKYSAKSGHDVRIIGVSKGMKVYNEIVQRDYFQVIVYNKFFGKCFEELKKQANEVDIVHLHSVWQHYNIIFARYLKSINKPYVVTIHSGLTEDRIKQSRYWTKLLYHKLFQKKIFDNSAGIHAITQEEMLDIVKYTSNKNIFYVQNGIDLNNFRLDAKNYNQDSDKITFGYLGRFGKEKNISGLINAISLLPKNILDKLECFLIGPIEEGGCFLKKLVNELDLEQQIFFAGPKYGEEKYDILRKLDFYVHPAFSDVVSIAVMEAMAMGLPCLITRTSQVSYYYNSNAFVMVEPMTEDIKRGLIEIIGKKNKWPNMSKQSILLVENIFNWDNAVERMLTVYESILIAFNENKNQ
jgi:glycosyltransferase involved in cell wall biosynthesis